MSENECWIILNPRSGRGRTGRGGAGLAAAIAAAVGGASIRWTKAPMHASRLAREALDAGARRVVAVGGDGTISEVVNGLLAEDGAGDVALGIITSGTGGDFRRSIAIPRDLAGQLAILRDGTTRRIDVGRLSFFDDDGDPVKRHFMNTASAGMSGEVCDLVNRMRWTKRLGGSVAFNVASLRALARYPNPKVRLRIDDRDPEEVVANTIAVCNGRYFGGGMQIAPDAALDDGLLDIVTLGDLRWFETVRAMPSLYRGTHLEHPKARHFRARTLQVEPIGPHPLRLEADGEAPGRAPVTFAVRPRALRLIAPPAAGKPL